jgi:hypothetical protein
MTWSPATVVVGEETFTFVEPSGEAQTVWVVAGGQAYDLEPTPDEAMMKPDSIVIDTKVYYLEIATRVAPISRTADTGARRISVRYDEAGGTLEMHVAHAARLSVWAYALNGSRLAALSKDQHFAQGSHSFALPRLTGHAAVLVHIQGEGFSLAEKVNLTTGR